MLKHRILALIFLSLILFTGYPSLLPAAHAAEHSLQTETLSVLSEVVGVKIEQYTTSRSIERDSPFLTHPQKETDMYLTSAVGSFRVTCHYVKDTLQLVYLSDVEGEHSLKQPAANTVDLAKGFLERYQNYAGDFLYGEFVSMLADVEVNVDLTKYVGNAKFEVSGSGQDSVRYKWTYVDGDGVLAERKNVILLYEQGFFKAFFNSWPLYTIVDTPKISSEEATLIALEVSKSYSYQVIAENGTERTVSGFTIAPESLGRESLTYLNSKEQEYARGGDLFKLYPVWHVPLGFDRFYPGDVSGMNVILWADSGEICGLNHFSTGKGAHPEAKAGLESVVESQIVSQRSTMLPMVVVVAAVFCMISLVTYKRVTLNSKKLLSKFWVFLFCTTIVFSALLTIPIANAASLTGRSRIYACIDGNGFGGYADVLEAEAIAYVCNYIGNASIDAGYVTSNNYGPHGTTATNVVNNAGSDRQNYQNTMMFHAGHKYADNIAYQDNNGNPIQSYEIAAQSGVGKHFFTFIWVCSQAEDPTYGMPAAWTQRTDMTDVYDTDGSVGSYVGSDGQGQCYIGFYGYSPMLSNHYETFGGNYSVFWEHNQVNTNVGPASWFIVFFYYFALDGGYSVRDSLNFASQMYFESDYASSTLNVGYDAWWPGGETMDPPFNQSGYIPKDFQGSFQTPTGERDPNRMRVFGDANVKLYQPLLTLSARDNNNNPLSPIFVIDDDNGYGVPNSIRITNTVHKIAVTDNIFGFQFDHFSYNGVNYYTNPSNIPITTDDTLTAHYVPDQHIYIAESTGYTDPPAGYYRGSGTMEITAYAYNGYQFSHWLLNSEYLSSNPTIYVDYGSNTVQPIFEGNPTYWLTIDAYEIYYEDWISTEVYIDGYYAGEAPLSVQVNGGWHTVEVANYAPDPNSGPFYLIGFSDELENGDPRLIQSDTDITAIYDLGGK